MNTAVDLSKYIVNKCIADGHPISNLQLQKILFYVQKDFLDIGQLAFPDEIEAWQFGPVVPNAYYYFCGFGSMRINIPYPDEAELTDTEASIVDRVIREKSTRNPWDVVAETHRPGGAWARVYKNGEGNHCPIPLKYIREAG